MAFWRIMIEQKASVFFVDLLFCILGVLNYITNGDAPRVVVICGSRLQPNGPIFWPPKVGDFGVAWYLQLEKKGSRLAFDKSLFLCGWPSAVQFDVFPWYRGWLRWIKERKEGKWRYFWQLLAFIVDFENLSGECYGTLGLCYIRIDGKK